MKFKPFHTEILTFLTKPIISKHKSLFLKTKIMFRFLRKKKVKFKYVLSICDVV